MKKDSVEPLSDDALKRFREAHQIAITGKGTDGTTYNKIGCLNQAAWIGENVGLLLNEIDRLKAMLAGAGITKRSAISGVSVSATKRIVTLYHFDKETRRLVSTTKITRGKKETNEGWQRLITDQLRIVEVPDIKLFP